MDIDDDEDEDEGEDDKQKTGGPNGTSMGGVNPPMPDPLINGGGG